MLVTYHEVQEKGGWSMSTLTNEIIWGEESVPARIGMKEAGVKKILDVYTTQLSDGLHYGSQLVVLRNGEVVLDRAEGLANVHRKLKVTADTPFHCFSITKPFTAVCIHKLIEEGRIELDAPVAKYWPEFGTKGKETATIRHALLHQAGIPSRGLYTQIPLWVKWDRVTHNVANLQAEFPPGTRAAYHMVNFGFILGEVVRRVTGKPVESYLQENFLQPLNMKNTCLGLPREKQKNAAYIYSGDKTQTNAAFLFNLPMIRSAVVPAATLNSTARDLAVFFQMLVNHGTYAGREYLKPETIAKAISVGYEGYDDIIMVDMRWGLGFDLGEVLKPSQPHSPVYFGNKSSLTTFGHIGQNSSMVWADSEKELVVCFTTNRLLADIKTKERFEAISDAVWDAII
jgi:CubicO group peptidase (beta-lactamase class C family)